MTTMGSVDIDQRKIPGIDRLLMAKRPLPNKLSVGSAIIRIVQMGLQLAHSRHHRAER
jgi:hypothetical protein